MITQKFYHSERTLLISLIICHYIHKSLKNNKLNFLKFTILDFLRFDNFLLNTEIQFCLNSMVS